MRPFSLRSTTALAMALSASVVDATESDAGLSSLLSRSQTLRTTGDRNLADQQQQYDASYAYDLSSYSVRYDKCQYVKTYDDELAADVYSTSPLAMKHFVLFRLCPSDYCSSTCTANTGDAFGRYMTDVDTYLQYTVEQQKDIFDNYCNNCDEQNCAEGECTTDCGKDCYLYNNMAGAGYVDASEFIQCQELVANNDGCRKLASRRKMEDAGDEAVEEEKYYIGPRCYEGGIEIGLFSDARCYEPLEDLDVEDVLGAQLSYYFLEHTFTTTNKKHNAICLTCEENDNNANNKDKNDNDNVNEMCEGLYSAAAKCESPNGMTSGFISNKRKNKNYENQVENEFLSCAFINSLLWNSYTEKGEIDHQSRQDVYVRHVTGLEARGMCAVAVCFACLVGLVFYMQKKIESVKGNAKILKVDGRAIFA